MQKSAHAGSVTMHAYATPVVLAGVAFCIDQVTKRLGRGFMAGEGPFPQILTVVHHHNAGLVANLPVPLPLIILMTFAVLALVLWMLWMAIQRGNAWGAGALGLLLGGALGNAWDRLTVGYVFDWILLFGRSAINIADLCIVCGALVYAGSVRRGNVSTSTTAP